MNEQTKELIAIGASIAAHCQPCLKYHYAKARELGIEMADIHAAMELGQQVSSGAEKAIRDFQSTLTGATSAEAGSEGCGGDAKCC